MPFPHNYVMRTGTDFFADPTNQPWIRFGNGPFATSSLPPSMRGQFVFGEDEKYCLLCFQNLPNEPAVQAHVRMASHQANVQRVIEERNQLALMYDRGQNFNTIRPRIGQLLSPVWKNSVKVCFFDDPDQAAVILLKYEQAGRLLLLMLAVWKAQCWMNMPLLDCLGAKEFFVNGWKELKEDQRQSSAMGIVAKRVAPFLGLSEEAQPRQGQDGTEESELVAAPNNDE